MHTVPDKREFSRLEDMEIDGSEIIYPDIENNYLVKMLYEELGACTSNGSGLAPLSWNEIESWQRLTGNHLEAFESEIIKKASEAYVSQTIFSKDPACLPPVKEIVQSDKETVSSKVQNMLRKKHGN